MDSRDDCEKKGSVATFGGGSAKQRRRPSYFELSDKSDLSTLKSTISVPAEMHMVDNRYQGGIVRTVGITQREHETESVDRLV